MEEKGKMCATLSSLEEGRMKKYGTKYKAVLCNVRWLEVSALIGEGNRHLMLRGTFLLVLLHLPPTLKIVAKAWLILSLTCPLRISAFIRYFQNRQKANFLYRFIPRYLNS